MNRYSIVVIFYFLTLQAQGVFGSYDLDSIQAVIDTTSSVEEKVECYIILGAYNKIKDLSAAHYNMDRAVAIADSIGNDYLIARAAYFQTTIYMSWADHENAFTVLDRMDAHLNKENLDLDPKHLKEFIFQSKELRATIAINNRDLENGTAQILELISLVPSMYEEGSEDYHLSLAVNYETLCRAYSSSDTDLSLKYVDKALYHYQFTNNVPTYLSWAFYAKAITLSNAEATFDEIKAAMDSAFHYVNMTDAAVAKAELDGYMCGLYSKHDNAAQGLEHCERALSVGEENLSNYSLGNIYFALSTVYSNQGKIDLAVETLHKSKNYADDINDSNQNMLILYNLSDVYYKKGDYKKSTDYLAQYVDSLESFNRKQYAESISDAQEKYRASENEAEIARQQLLISKAEANRNLILGSSLAILIILAALFVVFRQHSKRKRDLANFALKLEKQRADELEKLAKHKTDFFNNVSHELRTPLTLVIAPLEDLVTEIKNVNHKKDIELALNNSKRLLNLTNEILDLSKIEGNKTETNISDVELCSFLKRVFHSFDSLTQSRKITLLSSNLDQELCIQTDSEKLEKVIINLVANAIKYSPNGSTVSLELHLNKLNNNIIHIKIIDNGYGINQKDQEHIFDRFYQSERLNHSSGTGIGLALVREYMTLLNGSIKVESEVDKGSTFTIELKDIQIIESKNTEVSEININEEKVEYTPLAINGKKPRILIVEDDLEMSKYLRGLLKDQYNCEAVYNGTQAIESLKKKRFDLITSDVMMPQMDGFQFREKVNEHPELKHIPFILLTARSMEEDKLKGFRLGIDDYITKPFSTSEYKARVYNLLKNKNERNAFKNDKDEKLDNDTDFINRAESIVMKHIDDSSFSVTHLAKELNYSNRQLGRILQRLTGLTPVTFILEIRLQKAYQIIKLQKYSTVSEVMYDVGIESASYFTSRFKERFGINPGKL